MSFLNVNVDDNNPEITQRQLEIAREDIRILTQQNEQLQSELQQLKNNSASIHQLSTYQNALAISESHKQSIQDENQRLRAENSAFRMKLEQLGVNLEQFGGSGTMGAGVISMDQIMGGGGRDGDVLIGSTSHHEEVEDGSTSNTQPHHHAVVVDAPPPLDITTEEALAAIEQHVHEQQDDDHHHKEMIGLSSSSRTEEKWDSQLALLEKYKQEHGNCLVPTNTELGRWLSRQRNNHMNNTLKEDRRRRLEEIDSTCLGERLTDLRTTHPSSFHGTANTATHNTTQEEGVVLDDDDAVAHGITIQNKTKYNQEYEGKLHEKWNVFFTQLVDFKNKTGHANFPTMHGSLGRWISRQRTLYRQSKLKADRYEKLKDIGFMFEDATADEFQNKNDKAWLEMFQQLEEHKRKKGHCFDIPENSKLGKWLYRQRWMYRKGNLRDDRAKKLKDIGFEERKYDYASGSKISESSKNTKKGKESTTKKKRRRNSEDEEEYNPATVGDEAAV